VGKGKGFDFMVVIWGLLTLCIAVYVLAIIGAVQLVAIVTGLETVPSALLLAMLLATFVLALVWEKRPASKR
jgi:hypothetical protein